MFGSDLVWNDTFNMEDIRTRLFLIVFTIQQEIKRLEYKTFTITRPLFYSGIVRGQNAGSEEC